MEDETGWATSSVVSFFVGRDRDELSTSSESRLAITRTNHHRISQATVLGDSQQIWCQSGNAGEVAMQANEHCRLRNAVMVGSGDGQA